MSNRQLVPHLFVDGELPGLDLFWLNTVGVPVSVHGYNLTLTFEQNGTETTMSGASMTAFAAPTKDTGSVDDVPSVSVSFTQNALHDIVPGPLVLRLKAQSQNRHRVFRADLIVDR